MTTKANDALVERAKALREECRKGVEERGVMPNYVSACVTLNHLAPKLLLRIEALEAEIAESREVFQDVWDGVMTVTREADGNACPICHSSGDHDKGCPVPKVRKMLTGDFTYAPTDLEDCGE